MVLRILHIAALLFAFFTGCSTGTRNEGPDVTITFESLDLSNREFKAHIELNPRWRSDTSLMLATPRDILFSRLINFIDSHGNRKGILVAMISLEENYLYFTWDVEMEMKVKLTVPGRKQMDLNLTGKSIKTVDLATESGTSNAATNSKR